MLNLCIYQGRLVADPELRYTGSNIPVCTFRIAIDKPGKSGSGEKKTTFITCVAWRQNAEFVAKYFSKGKLILVQGSMEQRSYESKGENRTVLECNVDSVNFCDSKKEDSSGSTGNSYGGYSGYAQPATAGNPASDFAQLDDDDAQLPF